MHMLIKLDHFPNLPGKQISKSLKPPANSASTKITPFQLSSLPLKLCPFKSTDRIYLEDPAVYISSRGLPIHQLILYEERTSWHSFIFCLWTKVGILRRVAMIIIYEGLMTHESFKIFQFLATKLWKLRTPEFHLSLCQSAKATKQKIPIYRLRRNLFSHEIGTFQFLGLETSHGN